MVEEAIHPLPVEVHQLGPTSNFVSNLQFLNKPPLLSFVTLPVPKFITRPHNHTQTLSTFHPHPAALLPMDQLASSMLPGCQPNNPDPETIEKEFLSSPPFSETIEFLENLPQISSQENSARFKATEATPRPFQWSRGLVQLPNTTLTCPNADNIANLPPVPLPPYDSPHYKLAMERISNHIHLFPISHSIKIDVLAQKLRTMNFPNIPLLDSLHHSFQHGFLAGNDEHLAHYTRDPLITPNDDNSPKSQPNLTNSLRRNSKPASLLNPTTFHHTQRMYPSSPFSRKRNTALSVMLPSLTELRLTTLFPPNTDTPRTITSPVWFHGSNSSENTVHRTTVS